MLFYFGCCWLTLSWRRLTFEISLLTFISTAVIWTCDPFGRCFSFCTAAESGDRSSIFTVSNTCNEVWGGDRRRPSVSDTLLHFSSVCVITSSSLNSPDLPQSTHTHSHTLWVHLLGFPLQLTSSEAVSESQDVILPQNVFLSGGSLKKKLSLTKL